MTENINLKIVQLLESLTPLVDAVECNDGDTLNALTSDETVIFLAEGSWSKRCAHGASHV